VGPKIPQASIVCAKFVPHTSRKYSEHIAASRNKTQPNTKCSSSVASIRLPHFLCPRIPPSPLSTFSRRKIFNFLRRRREHHEQEDLFVSLAARRSASFAHSFPIVLDLFTSFNPSSSIVQVPGVISDCPAGQTAKLQAVIAQESTGAVAAGEWLGICEGVDQNYVVKTRRIAGSPKFEEGTATVYMFDVARKDSNIVAIGQTLKKKIEVKKK
jgi:hypothetical protein